MNQRYHCPASSPGQQISEHRTRILTIARTWIGTPFHHRASLRGVGTDCLGLIRGIWRDLHGEEPEPLPDYSPDWAEATGREDMLAAALRHLIPVQTPQPGDVLLFRLTPTGPTRHAGILAEEESASPDAPQHEVMRCWSGAVMSAERPRTSRASPRAAPHPGQRNPPHQTLIHAAAPHAVIEAPYTPAWQRRTTAAFAFP